MNLLVEILTPTAEGQGDSAKHEHYVHDFKSKY